MKTIKTVWELRTYDVWGNAQDGYEVNDCFRAGTAELRLRINTHNADTVRAFQSAHPSDSQLQRIFNVGCNLETDGDDTTVYVNRASDGYPLGEAHCISHESLSPIRAKTK